MSLCSYTILSLLHSQLEQQKLQEAMKTFQQQVLESVKNVSTGSVTVKPQELAGLFCNYVDAELKLYR